VAWLQEEPGVARTLWRLAHCPGSTQGVSGTNMAAWSGRQRLGALSMVGDPVGRRDLGSHTRQVPRVFWRLIILFLNGGQRDEPR
jgi:hypothetical protein